MAIPLRSNASTFGRRMAGARSLWRSNGMKEEHFGKPIIAIVNSFTQFVPGHVHLHQIGQHLKGIIARAGCFAAHRDAQRRGGANAASTARLSVPRLRRDRLGSRRC